MIINLNPNWRIRTDPHQWILEKHPNRQEPIAPKSKEWRPVGYFKSIAGALHEAAQRQVRELPGVYGPEALEPLCSALSSIREDIARALDGKAANMRRG